MPAGVWAKAQPPNTLLPSNRIPRIGKPRRLRTVFSHVKQHMTRHQETKAEDHYWRSSPASAPSRSTMAAAFRAIKAASQAKFPGHRVLVDQLSHLNVTKKWS